MPASSEDTFRPALLHGFPLPFLGFSQVFPVWGFFLFRVKKV
jgi:hypothetical protein